MCTGRNQPLLLLLRSANVPWPGWARPKQKPVWASNMASRGLPWPPPRLTSRVPMSRKQRSGTAAQGRCLHWKLPCRMWHLHHESYAYYCT